MDDDDDDDDDDGFWGPQKSRFLVEKKIPRVNLLVEDFRLIPTKWPQATMPKPVKLGPFAPTGHSKFQIINFQASVHFPFSLNAP